MNDYELYHASTRKHKYIKKIGNRYFYTQQEIEAYLEGKKPKSDLTFEKDNVHGRSNADTPTEYRKKQREKASQKVSNYAEKTAESMKKQASRGKKALDKWYTKATTPDITVTYDEAVIKDNKSSSKTTNTTKKKKPKKQKSKARKAINKFYRNNINPGVTVTYDEAKIK